ncbi:BMP family ABC transporter substrate-binding protein [Butyrivibrio sp. VCD2006]|uniref:BMP family ABC transporter substrate-binding protein n=1 Tax=Butyrivibrio sp. VCD2006 TaxID=1280664 RepID=UPI0003FAB53A|nr:BMP family ABC transporter substrate-binding protein [Butyrivibrio sp. VCD2006]
MKKIRENIWIIILTFLLVALLGAVVFSLTMSRKTEVKATKVGALFIDNVDDGGWNQRHYEGIYYACKSHNLKLEIEENVSETVEDAEPAIERLVAKGCNVIFMTSNGFDKKLYPMAEKYPEVQFYTTSPDSTPDNMTTYYGRHYQVRYLAGMLAGRMTKTNVLGFVAGNESTQTIRSINAFTLGARAVNPDAEVKVRYMHTWTDPELEKELARKLIEEDGADVITYHASLHTAIDAAEELGAYSIGYNNSSTDYSDKYLASVNFNWENLYQRIMDDYSIGDMSPGKYYWHGVVFGTVEIDLISSAIPQEVREEIADRIEKLINVQDVFYGDIYTTMGEKKCSKGQRISDNALLRKMNWYVKGVKIYE